MIITGGVLPPKPKPKPKPKPHKLYGSEDFLYTDWDADFSEYTEKEIEVFAYIESEGFAIPEDGDYALESSITITVSDGFVVFVS